MFFGRGLFGFPMFSLFGMRRRPRHHGFGMGFGPRPPMPPHYGMGRGPGMNNFGGGFGGGPGHGPMGRPPRW